MRAVLVAGILTLSRAASAEPLVVEARLGSSLIDGSNIFTNDTGVDAGPTVAAGLGRRLGERTTLLASARLASYLGGSGSDGQAYTWSFAAVALRDLGRHITVGAGLGVARRTIRLDGMLEPMTGATALFRVGYRRGSYEVTLEASPPLVDRRSFELGHVGDFVGGIRTFEAALTVGYRN